MKAIVGGSKKELVASTETRLHFTTLMTLFVVPALYDIFQRRAMVKVEADD